MFSMVTTGGRRRPINMATNNMKYHENIDTYGELNREIEAYWDSRSDDFSKTRRKELEGPSAEAWSRLLKETLPQGQKLRILDIGTAPVLCHLIREDGTRRDGHRHVGGHAP